MGQVRPSCGHEIHRLHRPHRNDVFVTALVAGHTHRSNRQIHRKRLAHRIVEPGRPQLLDEDCVGAAEYVGVLLPHLAEDAYPQAGPRKRMAVDELERQPELDADGSHLVLEQLAEWFHETHVHPLRQPPHVVVRLDDVRLAGRGAGGLDDVGVDGALREPRYSVELRRLLLEELDERTPDALALLLRIGDAGKGGEKAILGVDAPDVDPQMSGEGRHDLVAFVEPEQPVVDEDACQLVADGTVEKRRDHGGIDASREREQHPVGADRAAHPRDAVVDDRAGSPARCASADVVHEPVQDACALAGMGDLGMELDTVEAALLVRDPRDGRAVRRCDELEPGRQRAHAIAVAHPHVEQSVALGVHLVLDAGEQP